MKPIFYFLILTFLLTSCNDGDILTAELDFDDSFKICGELVCYKIKTDPSESLSLQLNTTIDDLIETEVDSSNPLLVNIINNEFSETISTSNPFNYRTYSNEVSGNIFCSAIPPSNLGVTNDYTSTVGNANFIVLLIEDDNDGIPAEFEDINNDGDLENDDTDGDGLPNYLDDDDDGDNVKTVTEMPNFTVELQLTAALDTDGDSMPDYLDTDDDNDGVPTINEEGFTANQNPADDITNNLVGPDYKNIDVTNNVPATAFRSHTIKQEFQVSLQLTNIDLPILTQDVLEFGVLESSETSKTRTVTPQI